MSEIKPQINTKSMLLKKLFDLICSFNKSVVFTKEENFLYAADLQKLLEKYGCKVLDSQLMYLRPDEVRRHYPHIVGLPFYPSTQKQFDDYPVVVMKVRGRLKRILEAIGTKTDADLCAVGSFRKTRGKGKEHNAAHRTGSFWERFKEYPRFFGQDGYVIKYRKDTQRQHDDQLKLAKLLLKMNQIEP